MRDFSGRIAVVTGGGSGIGRELVRQLVAEGCHVAMADVSVAGTAETERLCRADGLPQGSRLLAHEADVSDEAQVLAFADAVRRTFETDQIHLLFNNAGVSGGGSLFLDTREDWDRTFAITFGGVYLCTRAFLPMLVAADAGHIVNVSSVNGFWASTGGSQANSAYATAKFAVKGFTEAMIADLASHAPHIACSVVMPGIVGTDIVGNSQRITARRGGDERPGADEIAAERRRIRVRGFDEAAMSDDAVVAFTDRLSQAFRDSAPTSAAEAAKIIIDGVKRGTWRILVGEDAHVLDEKVRGDPEGAYRPGFFQLWDRPNIVSNE